MVRRAVPLNRAESRFTTIFQVALVLLVAAFLGVRMAFQQRVIASSADASHATPGGRRGTAASPDDEPHDAAGSDEDEATPSHASLWKRPGSLPQPSTASKNARSVKPPAASTACVPEELAQDGVRVGRERAVLYGWPTAPGWEDELRTELTAAGRLAGRNPEPSTVDPVVSALRKVAGDGLEQTFTYASVKAELEQPVDPGVLFFLNVSRKFFVAAPPPGSCAEAVAPVEQLVRKLRLLLPALSSGVWLSFISDVGQCWLDRVKPGASRILFTFWASRVLPAYSVCDWGSALVSALCVGSSYPLTYSGPIFVYRVCESVCCLFPELGRLPFDPVAVCAAKHVLLARRIDSALQPPRAI